MGLKTGILGINARNLLFIRPFNKRQAVQLADNKLKTKHFLGSRGIPIAKLHCSIRGIRELEKFDWSKLPKNFALKPNRGYGGEGFRLVHDFDSSSENQIQSITEHVLNILDGNYSLSNAPDIALIEQEIIPHTCFSALTTYGLPDIRIIVFNRIPVMAMLRLPTRESGGTANLHQGGAIVGLDMATGEASHMFYRGKSVDRLPDSIGSIQGFTTPKWDEMLLIAVKTQILSNVGYLAVDIVLDQKEQPLVLELNAHGGLGIQLANMAPLRRRLERVRGVRVTTPEKGVRMGKDLFGRRGIEREVEELTGKHILGHTEHVELLPPEKKGKPYQLIAQIDQSKVITSLDITIAREIGLVTKDDEEKTLKTKEFTKLEFILGEKRIKTAVSLKDYSKAPYNMIIGNRDLKDFLIDPSRTADSSPLKSSKSKKSVKMQNVIRTAEHIDAQLVLIDRELSMLKHLRPLDSGKEERAFFDSGCTYNPKYSYARPQVSRDIILQTLDRCKTDQTPIGQLLQKKIEELRTHVEFVYAIGKLSFTEASKQAFGAPSSDTITDAKRRIDVYEPRPESEHLDSIDAQKVFEKALRHYGLNQWVVKRKENMVADVAVGKLHIVHVREDAMFTPQRIDALVRHEIETHVLSTENGKLQPYKIFAQGCANYHLTQEGLAVYNQSSGIGNTEFPKSAATAIAIAVALQGSFVDVYRAMLATGLSEHHAFRIAFKVKRGLTDTSKPGACTRNYIYFAGLYMIEQFVNTGGDIRELYVGKIALQDLELVKQVEGLVKPKYLPDFLASS